MTTVVHRRRSLVPADSIRAGQLGTHEQWRDPTTERTPQGGSPVDGRDPSQRGVVGGLEVLPFGVLIFVAFTLVIANAWAVVDAKLAMESAAREAGRAYVEAHEPVTAHAVAHRAAEDAVVAAGRDAGRLALAMSGGPYVRCEVVEHRASYVVPALTVPFVGSFGSGITVSGSHRSVVDPFASGNGRANSCGF